MLGHFAACPTNVVCIGSLAPCFRVATASCSARRLCALCVSPFSPASGRLSTLTPRPSYRTPPFPFSFLYSFGDMTARTPASSSGPDPLSSPYFPLRRSHRKRTMSPTLSPQHAPFVYSIPAASASGVLRPTSVHCYKIPLVLALLLHPHSPRIRSRATKSSRHCGAKFIS